MSLRFAIAICYDSQFCVVLFDTGPLSCRAVSQLGLLQVYVTEHVRNYSLGNSEKHQVFFGLFEDILTKIEKYLLIASILLRQLLLNEFGIIT